MAVCTPLAVVHVTKFTGRKAFAATTAMRAGDMRKSKRSDKGKKRKELHWSYFPDWTCRGLMPLL